jgi:hypothetical protein
MRQVVNHPRNTRVCHDEVFARATIQKPRFVIEQAKKKTIRERGTSKALRRQVIFVIEDEYGVRIL